VRTDLRRRLNEGSAEVVVSNGTVFQCTGERA